jgi:hypothetical protein
LNSRSSFITLAAVPLSVSYSTAQTLIIFGKFLPSFGNFVKLFLQVLKVFEEFCVSFVAFGLDFEFFVFGF